MAARIQPDRAALERAHFTLRVTTPLDEMLAHPCFRRILENVARRQTARRTRIDVKKLQANDTD